MRPAAASSCDRDPRKYFIASAIRRPIHKLRVALAVSINSAGGRSAGVVQRPKRMSYVASVGRLCALVARECVNLQSFIVRYQCQISPPNHISRHTHKTVTSH